jgi:hypothetical protein
MPIEIRVESTFQAPLEVAFAYTADYRNVPDWLYGISKFEPVGENDYGLGAVFDGSMNLGATLNSRIEPFVKIAVKHSSAALQKCVEAQVSR